MSAPVKALATRFVHTVPRRELGERAGRMWVCLDCSEYLESQVTPPFYTPEAADEYVRRTDRARARWWRLTVIAHETREAEYADTCELCGEYVDDYLWSAVGVFCDGPAMDDYERSALHRNDLEGLAALWARRTRQRDALARNDLRALWDSFQSGRVVRVSV